MALKNSTKTPSMIKLSTKISPSSVLNSSSTSESSKKLSSLLTSNDSLKVKSPSGTTDTELYKLFEKTVPKQEKSPKPLASEKTLSQFLNAIKVVSTEIIKDKPIPHINKNATLFNAVPTANTFNINNDNLTNKNSNRYTANTIFIANIPVACAKQSKDKDDFLRQLSEWIEIPVKSIASIRFRCLPILCQDKSEKSHIPKKVAIVKKIMDPCRDSVIAYVRFDDNSSIDLLNSLAKINGRVFQGKHLRADIASEHGSSGVKFIDSQTIFIGNLPRNAEEETLRTAIEGIIENSVSRIRLVRNSKTQQCTGVGYVEFKTIESAKCVLNLVTSSKASILTISGRQLRVCKCKPSTALTKGKDDHVNKRSIGSKKIQPIKGESNLKRKEPIHLGVGNGQNSIKKAKHAPATTKGGLPNRAASRKLLFSESSKAKN